MSRLIRALAFAAASLALATTAAGAAEVAAGQKHFALSLVGKPKFGPDLKHFDWVNPEAPKGGDIRQWAMGSFDSLNRYTFKGSPAIGLGLIFDTLMEASPDEPSTEYCLVCEWASYPPDYSSVTFSIRPEARFHDGKPITPEDFIFALPALKKSHPFFAKYYKNVVAVEKTGAREVTFRFDVKGNRELPHIVGQIPALPKHFWTATSTSGEPRDLAKSSLDVPLGSGPYKIGKFEPGRFITYERVKDWWAKDLPVTRGQYNFDSLRYVYYRDNTPAFEAFKSQQLDFWRESSSKKWATEYDVPPVRSGFIKKMRINLKNLAPMQGFAMNIRRAKFQDVRVRQAFNLAFDFQWSNKNLFYDQYMRVNSYFGNSELQSKGLPAGHELEILNEVKDQVPPQVFTTEFKNPVNSDSATRRANMSKASGLLDAAGWTVTTIQVDDPLCGTFCKIMMSVGLRAPKTERIRRNAKGEKFEVEFLLVSPDFQRVVLPYVRNLELLGIKATTRQVDSAQYKRRTDDFDFDIITDNFAQSHSPGNEQRDYWGSDAADRKGSRNTIGIKNPAVDKLIDKIIFAKDRPELVAATKALDRVLLWNHYVVPQWTSPYERIAVWDFFGRPKKQASQQVGFLRSWWYDKDAAAKLAAARNK